MQLKRIRRDDDDNSGDEKFLLLRSDLITILKQKILNAKIIRLLII